MILIVSWRTPAAHGQEVEAAFNHDAHRGLFPSCLTCHPGAADMSRAMWPNPSTCQLCHDGQIESRVEWVPAAATRRSNLRFNHGTHATDVSTANQQVLQCVQCHAPVNAPWLSVQVSDVQQCLDCHEISALHYDADDARCAQCHVTLVEADRLTVAEVGGFGVPSSHRNADFGGSGHGSAAQSPIAGVSSSCATCHARDFCITCHVDAPEQPAIQSLGLDSRSLVHNAVLAAPASHTGVDYHDRHGREMRAFGASCATCHTRESCTTCHVATPEVAVGLHEAASGRGIGAVIERSAPTSHVAGYQQSHAATAATTPATCAGCHARQDCLECHRPDAAATPIGYHPIGFLSRHGSAAYTRETSCSDCHNDRAFCATCHVSGGLTSQRNELLGSGYHDAQRNFLFGHGQAARQTLETCVTCHTERDCLSCHSATGSRRFNPHGPGFDAQRLRSRNPEMCSACHIGRPPGD